MSRTLTLWLAAAALAFAGATAAVADGWTEPQIRDSWARSGPVEVSPAHPAWNADPLALFVVVERDGRRLALVDGEHREVVARLDVRWPVQGAPVFSPDGRFVYLGSASGWVTKVDLWNLRTVAEVRAGLVQRQIALSSDGRWLMVANALPQSLVLLNAQLELDRTYAAATMDGKARSAVATVVDAGVRSSFVVALETIPEVWEISYDPHAEDIFDGIVHDYRMGEGIPRPGYLGVRRSKLRLPMAELWLDPPQAQVLGRPRAVEGRAAQVQVVNLDVRRRIAELPAQSWPLVAGAAAWPWRGSTLVALPDAVDAALTLIDRRGWKRVESILSTGPANLVATHPEVSQAWVAVGAGPASQGALMWLDKDTLEVTGQVPLAAPARHIAFDLAGHTVLVVASDGSVALFDTVSGVEIKRLPMEQPTMAFNVGNARVRPGPRRR